MHDTLTTLIASYGYYIVFALVAVESFGIPLPGETSLVTAAAFAALGRLSLAGVILAAAAGAIVGDNAGYWIGRKGGIALVRRYGARFGLDDGKLERARGFFERHGAKTVFIGRFVALLRSWAAALAGVSRMSYGTFMLWNALGGVTWSLIFGALGYLFGRNLPRLEKYVGQLSLALVLLFVLGVVLFFGLRWFRGHEEGVSEWLRARWCRITSATRFARLRARYPRSWAFVAARFSRGESLGLHLTLGFAVSAAALWIFAGVTEDVIHHDPLTLVDMQVAHWFRSHASPTLDRAALVVTDIGSPAAVGVLMLLVALWLASRRRWIPLAGWLAANVGGFLLSEGIKRLIQRPRPPGAAEFLHASPLGMSFSFPSGHATGSLIAYGMLGYLLVAFWPPARRHAALTAAITVALILAIGLTRLYLAVHYLSDVIGGFAAGTVWLSACVTGVEIALRQRGIAPWEVGLAEDEAA